MPRYEFSEEQLETIRLAYPEMSNSAVCKKFGVTNSWLEAFATKHTLRKNEKHNADLEVGYRSGDVEVLEKTDKRQKNNIMYVCRCLRCKMTFLGRGMVLRKKQIFACSACTRLSRLGEGHHRRGGLGPIGGSSWSKIASHAHERGIPFRLTIEEGVGLFERQGRRCALSGLPIRFPTEFKKTSSGTASLDRIGGKDAYELSNVRWTHKFINMMRGSHSDNMFLALCTAVVDHAKAIGWVLVPEPSLEPPKTEPVADPEPTPSDEPEYRDETQETP